jgi:hypothetical protein
MVSHPQSSIREGRKQRNPSFSLLGDQIDPNESEGLTSLIQTTLFNVATICPSPSSATPNGRTSFGKNVNGKAERS